MTSEDREWLRPHQRALLRRHAAPAVLSAAVVAALALLLGEWRFALVIAAAAAMWAALARRLVRAATEPAARASAAARAMARGNLDAHVPTGKDIPPALSSALIELRDQMRLRVEALEAEERKLRTVLDGLPDAVFLLEGGEVALANAEADTMFRTPAGGWNGVRLDGILPASLVAAIERGSRGEQVVLEECGPDATGRCLRATVLYLADGPTVLAIVSDVTERSVIDSVRRDFVANASHELKTPVAGILLLAETAEGALSEGDTAQAREFVSRISSEARHLRRLVLDLLDLSRLESATGPVSGTTDVRHAVDLAVSGHHAAAVDRGIELRVVDDAAGRDLFARADRTDVAVALDNLLDNALAYTEAGSVTVIMRAEDDRIALTVTDTGLGIPAEALPRVFERFYRVDPSRERGSGGTGIGLSLVKHVVERSGGSVLVASEFGKGSAFTITLPFAT